MLVGYLGVSGYEGVNILETVGRCVGVCVWAGGVVCSVTQGGIKMKPSKQILMTTIPPSSHTLVVHPLPHTHHTMYTPGTHTTLSYHPHRQVLCCHLQTCPPTRFHTYIRAVCRTMGIHIDAGETHTAAQHTWACTPMHVCTRLHILYSTRDFSVPHHSQERGAGVTERR